LPDTSSTSAAPQLSSGELLGIPMATGAGLDVYSGVARASGRIWASRHKSTQGPADTAVIVVHPASNFLGHYMLGSLANCGVDAIGLCTRYVGNDSSLLMENCVLDIGAAISHLREDGYRRIVLIGNSGGGGLAALYQSQAESPTIVATPAGDPPDLTKADLPTADALIFLMAHPGRSIVFTEWFDPAITDELHPLERDPSLDMFLTENGPPFDAAFLSRYREAQIARNRRVTSWVHEQLDILDSRVGGLRDLPFAVHGTVADPRMLDLTIDPSDREATTPWGPASVATYTPVSLGHQASLRSWLSQWSLDESNGDGRVHAARVEAPVLVMYGSADEVCYPSHAKSLFDAVPHSRKELQRVDGATHYFVGRKDLVDEAATRIAEWITRSV
jgi:alpha-beta hydrolase superfamily lysophospholipase